MELELSSVVMQRPHRYRGRRPVERELTRVIDGISFHPGDPLNGGHPHLTLHAMLGPLDKASFYTRSFPFGPLGFYAIEDLIAEIRYVSAPVGRLRARLPSVTTPGPTQPSYITRLTFRASRREESSNNRIRSSHPPSANSNRPRPLTIALDAGSRSGLPNGLEITPSGELVSHPTPSDPPAPPRRTQRLDSLASASSAGSASSMSGLVGEREKVLMGSVPEGSKRSERGKGKGKEVEVELGEEIDLGDLTKKAEGGEPGQKLV